MDELREEGHGAERAYDGGDEEQKSVEDKNPGRQSGMEVDKEEEHQIKHILVCFVLLNRDCRQ